MNPRPLKLLFFIIVLIVQPVTAFQPGQTIQTAIDDAETNDTIYVPSGWYHENIIINKTLRLMKRERENPLL